MHIFAVLCSKSTKNIYKIIVIIPTKIIKNIIIKDFHNECACFNSIKLNTTNKNFIDDKNKIVKIIYLKFPKWFEKKAVIIVKIISKPSV